MPPGQHEDEDGTIVNNGGNVAPGLNRGEHIDKPENPNKPDKPENPGTEDSADSKVNKANSGTHIYTYDALNRMVSSQIAKELTNYTYDSLGNLVLETVKNKSVDYEYNELNQLVRKTTSTNDTYTYSYDKRGNRIAETGKKASQSFVYDATNRLVEGTNWKGDTSAYTYNGLGLRVNNLVTTHAGQTYDRDYVIDYTSPENDDLYVYAMGNGQLEYEQRHVYAGSERIEQITERGTGSWERTLYVHEDVMGNTRYYTKSNGQSFAELQYDAWGQPVSPNKLVNNDHGNYVFATFTGHIYDTTLDIYFAEARFYDATNRTWLAMDPIKDGLNWYQYCLSNPIIYVDLNGCWYVEIITGVVGFAAGAYGTYAEGKKPTVSDKQFGLNVLANGIVDGAAAVAMTTLIKRGDVRHALEIAGSAIAGGVAAEIRGENISNAVSGAMLSGGLGAVNKPIGAAVGSAWTDYWNGKESIEITINAFVSGLMVLVTGVNPKLDIVRAYYEQTGVDLLATTFVGAQMETIYNLIQGYISEGVKNLFNYFYKPTLCAGG